MKNLQKGFIVPVLLVIIALLVVGGGVYVYENKKAEVPAIVDNGAQQSNQNQQQTNTQTQQTNTQNSTKNNFSVLPNSGKAPLTITATFDGCNPLITWGDGTNLEGGFGMNTCGGGIPMSEHPILSKNHTYTVPGTYTISLFNSLNTNSKPISTATVTVTQSVSSDTKNSITFSITILSPNGSEKWDIKSTHTITWNVTGDTNNKLDLYLDQQYYPPGVCAAQPCGPFFYHHTIAKNVSSKTAYNWTPATDSTVYVGGEYTVRACLAGSTSNCDSSNAKFEIVDLAKENDQAPIVTNISGPTELTVGQSGTYTVSASDPDNDAITYTLAEILSSGQALSNGYGYTLLGTQNNTFSVSFPKTGFYSIYFQVLDKYGKVGGKDITVKVQ